MPLRLGADNDRRRIPMSEMSDKHTMRNIGITVGALMALAVVLAVISTTIGVMLH